MSEQPPRCRDCGVETFRQTAAVEVKTAAKARGARRITGRGMCSTCYWRWQQSGGHRPLLRERAIDPDQPVLCARCGIAHGRDGALCIDCEEVTAALGELHSWDVAS